MSAFNVVPKAEMVDRVMATEVSDPAGARSFTVAGLETILVVGVDDAMRDLATRVLRSAGYRVLAAARGADAVTLLEYHRGRLDLLITDTALPDMRGSELAARVLEDRPDLQVLYVSGNVGDVAQPGHMIGKPYTPFSLTGTVREVLDLQRRPKVA